jgi:hypothetical protein
MSFTSLLKQASLRSLWLASGTFTTRRSLLNSARGS